VPLKTLPSDAIRQFSHALVRQHHKPTHHKRSNFPYQIAPARKNPAGSQEARLIRLICRKNTPSNATFWWRHAVTNSSPVASLNTARRPTAKTQSAKNAAAMHHGALPRKIWIDTKQRNAIQHISCLAQHSPGSAFGSTQAQASKAWKKSA